jgi:hypothetical protein
MRKVLLFFMLISCNIDNVYAQDMVLFHYNSPEGSLRTSKEGLQVEGIELLNTFMLAFKFKYMEDIETFTLFSAEIEKQNYLFRLTFQLGQFYLEYQDNYNPYRKIPIHLKLERNEWNNIALSLQNCTLSFYQNCYKVSSLPLNTNMRETLQNGQVFWMKAESKSCSATINNLSILNRPSVRYLETKFCTDRLEKKHSSDKISVLFKSKDRETITLDTISFQKAQILCKVWDSEYEDGDQISILLNNQLILYKYEVSKLPHVFKLDMNEGINTLIIISEKDADGQGNTSKLKFINSKKETTVIATANKERNIKVILKLDKR